MSPIAEKKRCYSSHIPLSVTECEITLANDTFFFPLQTVPGCMDSISPTQSAFHLKFTVGNWWTTGQLDFILVSVPSGPQIYECSYILRSMKSLPSYKALKIHQWLVSEFNVFSFQLMKVHRLKHFGFKFMVEATNLSSLDQQL